VLFSAILVIEKTPHRARTLYEVAIMVSS